MSCVFFNAIVVSAQTSPEYIGETSIEFSTDTVFQFRSGVKEVFSNAKEHQLKVAILHFCLQPIYYSFGKCARNYYISTESHQYFSIIIDHTKQNCDLMPIDFHLAYSIKL